MVITRNFQLFHRLRTLPTHHIRVRNRLVLSSRIKSKTIYLPPTIRYYSSDSDHSKDKASSGMTPTSQPLSNAVESYWNDIATYFHEPGFFRFSSDRSQSAIKDTAFMHKLLSSAIASQRGQGDLLPSVITRSCCELYESLNDEGKIEFLRILARDFGVPRDKSVNLAQEYIKIAQQDPYSKAAMRAEQILRHAMSPSHNKFFDRVNQLPDGMKFLVDMRADLLRFISLNRDDNYLPMLSNSLKEKLQEWLIGFLKLERITWNSPAVVLEKISQYEAVHAVSDLGDLKRRVGPGRRVFGFFFRNMPNEPLVFVQVALVPEISNNVQEILNAPSVHPTAESIRCAIFYSITTQKGLTGIELGNFLIKRVVRDLANEFPQLQTFCTLSPIPGFRRWLEQLPKAELLISKEKSTLQDAGLTIGDFGELIKNNAWVKDVHTTSILRPILMRLCSRYILKEKRGDLALDPVANFHLRNGACAHRLNWMADTSVKGLHESFGIMVNYNYLLKHIERNNQRYLLDGTIPVSSDDPVLNEHLCDRVIRVDE
ncbi:uncharacterized protein VTP21DRAFT_10769 [Calcarisporiella thermophila]|uniref:uncharacterized protein n=1 Tax=Calcarisporiella thermophila TaxID=911321 RepID=UPI003743F265